MGLACDRLHNLSKTLVAILKAVKDLQYVAVYPGFRCNSFEPVWCHSLPLRHEVRPDRSSLITILITAAAVGILHSTGKLIRYCCKSVHQLSGCFTDILYPSSCRRNYDFADSIPCTPGQADEHLQTNLDEAGNSESLAGTSQHMSPKQPSLAKLAFIDSPETHLPRLLFWIQTLVSAR